MSRKKSSPVVYIVVSIVVVVGIAQVLTKGPQELLNKPHPRWRHSRPFRPTRLLATPLIIIFVALFRFILFFSSYLSYKRIYFFCDTWNIL